MNTALRYILGALSPASAAAIVAAAGAATPALCPEDCDKPDCAAHCEQAVTVLTTSDLRPQVVDEGVLVVRAVSAQPETKTKTEKRTYVKVIQKDDSGDYELIVEDGEPQAMVDGKPVSKKRIKKLDGGVWVILDENGEPMTKFHVGGAPGGVAVWSGDGPFTTTGSLNLSPQTHIQVQPDIRFGGPQGGQLTFATKGEPPKTMLGVVMGEPPQSVVEHFGIKGGKAVLLDRVIEGLPAAEAGLQKGDIIIKVEGAPEPTAEGVRKVLREKRPGDDLQVQVLRHGDKKSFQIKLKAFDAAQLGRVEPMAVGEFQFSPDQDVWFGGPAGGQISGLSAETRKQMEHALQALKEAEKQATGEARKAQQQARKAIEQFVSALEHMEQEGLTTGEAMRGDLGKWFTQFENNQMVLGDKPGMVFTLPKQNFVWRSEDGNQRIEVETEAEIDESHAGKIRKTDDTDARLQALTERLARIEKLLEKLTQDDN